MKKKLSILLGILVMASMVLSACGGVGPGAAAEPITLDINWGTEPPTADPSLATDTTSVDLTGNIFVGLTRFDPITGAVIPYLAESWDVSDDGLTYTFHLRDDIPWVHYNTGTAEVDLVTEGGEVSYVDAYDVEYGVKRTIDPTTASDYSYVLYIIKNAYDVNHGTEGFTLADIGVRAVDATTVEFELESPAGFFPAIAGMWIAMPMHQGTIEAAGDNWTEPGTIVTSGPYVMTEWVHGSELNLAKNPHWPEADTVQIEEIHGVMITESSTALALYENNELDSTGVPTGEVDRILAILCSARTTTTSRCPAPTTTASPTTSRLWMTCACARLSPCPWTRSPWLRTCSRAGRSPLATSHLQASSVRLRLARLDWTTIRPPPLLYSRNTWTRRV
jgi:oligopeptide transport system substrate-binding protein